MQPETATHKPKMTAYTLTFNEARQIRAVLESIKWADEIIVVDSFSTDGTVEIAREFGARIISEKFCGFGKLRNMALDAAQNDWILSIDADERCTPELATEVPAGNGWRPGRRLFRSPKKSFSRSNGCATPAGIPITASRSFSTEKKCAIAEDTVHEMVQTQWQTIGWLREHALQFPWPTLRSRQRKISTLLNPHVRTLHAEGRRASWVKMAGSPVGHVFKSISAAKGFRDGMPGFILADFTPITHF